MMRVQCDVCEKAVAQVVCCADEAALCLPCDFRVHAANKLASKHHRLRLLPNHPLPLCDICQEKGAFIFCLEDRALVCRKCDVCIHPANTLAAGHQRFLASGVRVALDSADEADASLCKPGVQPPSNDLHDIPSNNLAACPFPIKKRKQSRHLGEPQDQVQNSFKHLEEWQNEQGLSFPDLTAGYPLTDIEFSKTDLSPRSDQDWMMDLGIFDEHVYADSPAEVPQTSFTLSTGIAHTARIEATVKGKLRQDVSVVPDFDDVSVVPDLTFFAAQAPLLKRQKTVVGN